MDVSTSTVYQILPPSQLLASLRTICKLGLSSTAQVVQVLGCSKVFHVRAQGSRRSAGESQLRHVMFFHPGLAAHHLPRLAHAGRGVMNIVRNDACTYESSPAPLSRRGMEKVGSVEYKIAFHHSMSKSMASRPTPTLLPIASTTRSVGGWDSPCPCGRFLQVLILWGVAS